MFCCLLALPENLYLDGLFDFLNAREVHILRWLMKHHLKTVWTMQLNWTRLLTNDTYHLRTSTRKALLAYYHSQPTTIDVQTIKSIYSHTTTLSVQHSSTQSMELGFYPSTVLDRGICWSTNHSIHWHDTLHNVSMKQQFEWLTLPPWDLSLQHMYTMWLPREHTYVAPYVVSLVGEPEDTLCLTNFKCVYRFSMPVSNNQKNGTDAYEELTLGGRFVSSITHMQFVHYHYPLLVVSGQPLWYNSSSHYKCFGIWDIEKKTSLFSQLRTLGTHFLSSVYARWGIPELEDFMYYECLHTTPCGKWIHWKYNHTLLRMYVPTKQVQCTPAFYPFTLGRISSIAVCAVQDWIGVYYEDECVWKVFVLTHCLYPSTLHTNITPIHTFANQHKTQLHFFPFRRSIQFSRKIGTKVIVTTYQM